MLLQLRVQMMTGQLRLLIGPSTLRCLVPLTKARKVTWQVAKFSLCIILLSHCWLDDRKGTRPVKSCVLVCWWWRFDWSFARLVAPTVTTTSVVCSSNKIQNGDILIPANPYSPEKWPLKWRERERERERERDHFGLQCALMLFWGRMG